MTTSIEIFNRLVSTAKEHFRNYEASKEMVEVDGVMVEVEFHLVGQNASHQFSIGLLPDSRLVKYSSGEGCEWNYEMDCPEWETSITVINETKNCRWPYVGHW